MFGDGFGVSALVQELTVSIHYTDKLQCDVRDLTIVVKFGCSVAKPHA